MPDPVTTFADDVAVPLARIYGGAAKDAADGQLDFEYLDANAAKYGRIRGGELIGTGDNAWSVDQTTRDEVNRLLQEGMQEGWSPDRFADALEESGLFGEARAEVIARTEVAIAQNYGQVETYGEMGFTHVIVYDGDSDDECAAADGQEWTLEEALDNPVGHPNAIFAGTEVLTLGGVTTGYRAKWSGPAVAITTAAGNVLTVSANHPVLTGHGWTVASKVRKGDDVIRCGRRDDIALPAEPQFKHVHALVEQVFDALVVSGASSRIPAAPAHFHGDGSHCEGDIDVVRADGLLTGEWDAPAFLEKRDELVFPAAGPDHLLLPGEGARPLCGETVFPAAPGSVGLLDMGGIGSSGANSDAALREPVSECAVADADFARDLERRFAIEVTLDEVVDVRDVEPFVSHAFDLSTGHRTYFASGILVHNCVRSFAPSVN